MREVQWPNQLGWTLDGVEPTPEPERRPTPFGGTSSGLFPSPALRERRHCGLSRRSEASFTWKSRRLFARRGFGLLPRGRASAQGRPR
jgi:hypothetical protein